MQACKLAGSHAMGKGKVSVWDFSTRKLNKPIPSQNKAFHRERQCSRGCGKGSCLERSCPRCCQLECARNSTAPTLLPCPGGSTKQEYGSQIVSWWLFDLAVWAGRNQLCQADVGCAGVLACCTLSLSSWADQAYGDKMAGRPQALGLGERKLFAWKAGSEVFGKNSPKAPKMDEYVREGAWHKAAGKHLWTIMPALCYGRGMAWHMKGSRNWQSLGLLVKWIMMLSLEGASPHISKEKRWASLGSCCELVWAIKRP